MIEPDRADTSTWIPSVFHAEVLVACRLEHSWEVMLDYQAWNPDFAHAQVELLSGRPRTEGELVLIKLHDKNGTRLSEFYAETVKVVSQRRFVWYVYPEEGDAFRNFVDFGLAETPSGVKFSIDYYAQTPLPHESLSTYRQESEAAFRKLAAAFKEYCEAHAQPRRASDYAPRKPSDGDR